MIMIRDTNPHRPFRHKFMQPSAEPDKMPTATDLAVAQSAAEEMDAQIKAKELEFFQAHAAAVHPSLHQYIRREAGKTKSGLRFVRLCLDEHVLGVMTFRKEADGMNIICTPPTKTYGF